MKKSVAVLLLALLTVSLLLTCACGKSETSPDTTAQNDASSTQTSQTADNVTTANAGGEAIKRIYPEGAELPELHMTADVTEVSPGDLVTVTWTVSNAENLACLQFKTYFDDKVFSLYETDEANVNDLISYSNSKEGQVIYTGVCTTTVDIVEETAVFSITLQVNDDAEAGDHAVSCMVNQFMIGMDDDGSEIGNLVDIKNLDASLVISVDDDAVDDDADIDDTDNDK